MLKNNVCANNIFGSKAQHALRVCFLSLLTRRFYELVWFDIKVFSAVTLCENNAQCVNSSAFALS